MKDLGQQRHGNKAKAECVFKTSFLFPQFFYCRVPRPSLPSFFNSIEEAYGKYAHVM